MRVVISLWSFDMLQPNATNSSHPNNITYNRALLENDTNRQAYIDRYLTPLVTALRGTPGLYAYEIFNEPEGMGPRGWTPTKTTQAAIQKTVNWLAAAIHTADPGALVTNASQTFDYCSNGISGKSNWYSDSALRAAGGKQNGTLDFYEVHYYDANESPGLGHGAVAVRAPGDLLGPRQEAGHRRVLRGDDRRRSDERPLHQPLQQRLQRRLGLAIQRRRQHAHGNPDQMAVDADRDPERLQRAHG